MLDALAEHFGEHGRWTQPQGGLFIWATLDQRIDTTDLLALAQESERVAFVPGRAAYMDGRSGASSMRLNFAGVPDEDIREGVRRIGRVVREQVGLYGTLTDSSRAARSQRAPDGGGPSARPARGEAPRSETQPEPRAATGATERGELADVVELPRREEGAARRRRDR